jgi:hypothetical protein
MKMCGAVYGILENFHVTRLRMAANWKYQTNLVDVSHIDFEKIV